MISLNPARHGTQVLLKKVDLVGLGVVFAKTLALQLQCSRCGSAIVGQLKAAVDTTGNPDAASAGSSDAGKLSMATLAYSCWCVKCSNLVEVKLRPEIMH